MSSSFLLGLVLKMPLRFLSVPLAPLITIVSDPVFPKFSNRSHLDIRTRLNTKYEISVNN